MKKKTKLPAWAQAVLIIVGVILAMILAGGIYVFGKMNKINRAQEMERLAQESEYFESDESGAYEKRNPEDVSWQKDETVDGEDDIVNILLIGQDRREGEGRARSDAMILATFNKTDQTIKLTSLMRDTYVQIPGYSDNRINAAYAFGGMELLDETIKENFDVDIDGNIEVDFSGFKDVIDIVGGVNINVNVQEVDEINRSVKSEQLSGAGMHRLNGEQALAYARIRYVGNDDFGRTERQRTVIMSVFDEVKHLSISEMVDMADAIFPLLTTDMSSMELIGLATDVLSMGISTMETHNIPADASFEAANIQGMDVLVPNLDHCRRVLKEIIYGAAEDIGDN